MSLHEQWENYGEEAKARSTEEYKKVVEKYLTKERNVYASLLSHPDQIVEGTISELGAKYGMNDYEFLGFVDGINESLVDGPYELKDMVGDSYVKLNYDLKKLYWNMLDAKADWLYTLKEWDSLLTDIEKAQIKRDYNKSKTMTKIKKQGRNDPCSCGSGLKYKNCCLNKK
ncbi:SEC-C metal-binding domain-containing protein [Candidatus Epulonipiscium viviparus]|uniref:SEC-C metal-binding domain-containing protein n=1 Tax=Candidatus Epulonipiscium viviparus TaxID=420336 RepID=UPI00016C01C4|nr:SEC-C metal-binding domain-containing protein [Candidatus Epulopiscium viviparus]